MNHSICGENVKGDHAGLSSGALDGDVPAPGDIDLLTPGGIQGGCALGHFSGLESGTRDDVAEKHSCQGVLVSKEAVEGVWWDLGKSIVGGGEDGEGTLSSEGVDQAGSLDGSKEGWKLGGGDGELCDVLGGSWGRPRSAVVATSWRAGHQTQAGQADEGLHVEAEVVVSKIEAEWSHPISAALYTEGISYRLGYAVLLVQWLWYPELSSDQELHNPDVQCFMVTENALRASALRQMVLPFCKATTTFVHYDVT